VAEALSRAPVAAAGAPSSEATIFVNSLARNSVRVCTNASLILPILLRETVRPSPQRSRRLTAKDRKEALGRAKPTHATHCKAITFLTRAGSSRRALRGRVLRSQYSCAVTRFSDWASW
jgi:hypothetical protein